MTQPHPDPTDGDHGMLRRLTPAELPDVAGDDIPAWIRDEHALRFAIDGDAGVVALRKPENSSAAGQLAWWLRPEARGRGRSVAALRAVIEYAFGELGLRRVETYVARDNRSALRSAAQAGLRVEGTIRGFRPGVDARVLGRLASDPVPGTRDAFTAWLNSSLPTKRAIAQALIRDEAGRLLVCELVYKKPWDLPGGVVDPNEPPAAAVVRELGEELGVTAQVRSLAAVSWLPPWHGWDDATLFLFEVSVPAEQLAAIRLEKREIRAVHWCDFDRLEEYAADYTVRVARLAVAALDAGTGPAYLEDGRPPSW